jgi:hypothetical protein
MPLRSHGACAVRRIPAFSPVVRLRIDGVPASTLTWRHCHVPFSADLKPRHFGSPWVTVVG